jgi:4-amino-4-deoxy-L-arabinose transferase-like glycosyltransferase
MFDTQRLPRLFALLLGLTLAFRFWLAAATPITGDEAYFIFWGRIPDWGFYDHPPMVGWWLTLLLRVADAEWWLRLPSVLQPAVLSLATRAILRREGEAVSWGAALLVLLAPANVWNIAITTDTPLVYFSFFSALAFIRAARDEDWRFYWLSGLLLGAAFLSKYFSVLLGLAYAVHALHRPTRAKLAGLGWVVLAALPGPLLNIWWNMDHCWANVMFNLYNRHDKAGWSWRTPLLYAVTLAYLLTPVALWQLGRLRAALADAAARADRHALLCVAFVPLAMFAVLSPVKTIGMHWLLSFVPFVLIAAVLVVGAAQLRQALRFFSGFAAAHVVLIVAVALLPVETWKSTRFYDGVVMTVKSQELLAQLEPYAQDYAFAADGYSPAVTLGHNARRYFFVFGEGSSHARHDDILTDFRVLDGKNVLVVRKSAPEADAYGAYFRAVEVKTVDVRGARYWLVLGRGFDYATYRDRVLEKVRQRWYAIPDFLPQRQCYFCERYFPDRPCRR